MAQAKNEGNHKNQVHQFFPKDAEVPDGIEAFGNHLLQMDPSVLICVLFNFCIVSICILLNTLYF